jgi:hypothetical protein
VSKARLVKPTLAKRSPVPLVVEPDGEHESDPCACCGTRTYTIWGYIAKADITLAVYYVSWTPGHLERGASFEFILGNWRAESTAADRRAIMLRYGVTPQAAGFMVVDAPTRADDELVGKALKRKEVVGTPLAAQAFALADAVWLQDKRLAALRLWPKLLQ